MKQLSATLNVILIGVVIWLGLDEIAYLDFETFLILVVFTLTPVVNLIYILTYFKDAGWLSTYFKRKRLEEEQRINELETLRKNQDG